MDRENEMKKLVMALHERGFEKLNELEKLAVDVLKDSGCKNHFIAETGYRSGKTTSIVLAAIEWLITNSEPEFNDVNVVIVSPDKHTSNSIYETFEQFGFAHWVDNSYFATEPREPEFVYSSTMMTIAERPPALVKIVSPTFRFWRRQPPSVGLLLIDNPSRIDMATVVDLMLDLPMFVKIGLFINKHKASMEIDTFKLFEAVWMSPAGSSAAILHYKLPDKLVKCEYVIGNVIESIDRIYEHSDIVKTLVFCKTERQAMELVKVLLAKDYDPLWYLSSHEDDPFRKMFKSHKAGSSRILVTLEKYSHDVDFMAKDVLSLVINLSIPDAEHFVACNSYPGVRCVTILENDDASLSFLKGACAETVPFF